MTRNMLMLALAGPACLVMLGCESKEDRQARIQAASRTAIAAESARAAGVVGAPSTGAWNDSQLVKRLVEAGLAPQRRDSARAQPWMGAPVHAFTLGVATLDAYIFRDSVARREAVAKLDPLTFAPRGQPSPWGVPRDVVENNNLVAVIVGGTDRQRDRIATALAAGLGAP